MESNQKAWYVLRAIGGKEKKDIGMQPTEYLEEVKKQLSEGVANSLSNKPNDFKPLKELIED